MIIEKLLVLQSGFRLDVTEMQKMVAFVKSGGVYSQDQLIGHNSNRKSLIAISCFEDGACFIRDGFHRIASIFLGGREYLFSIEFVLEPMTYSRFINLNLKVEWYTPLDPRIEVRLPDFFSFKKRVMEMINGGDDPTTFILRNKHLYAVPRLAQHNLKSLVQVYYPTLS